MLNRLDSMLSHGMGKVKAVKARLSGLVGVFALLAEEHGEIVVLLQRARTSSQKFTELWPTIRTELLSHERAETREVYALLRTKDEAKLLAEQHDVQAGELEQMVARLDELSAGTVAHEAAFQRLADAVTQHAREEETDLFPRAQKVLGKDQAETIEAVFLTTKNAIAAKL